MNFNFDIKIVTSKRRTIGLYIRNTKLIEIRAPAWVSKIEINNLISRKQKWIEKHLSKIATFWRDEKQEHQYIQGETFFYLGSEFKLNIINLETKQKPTICLEKIEEENKITVYVKSKTNIKTLLNKWFKQQAKSIFNKRLQICFTLFTQHYACAMPELKIRCMKARWGSMSSRNIMTLNTNLLRCELDCIDCVIMHELCHIKHKNHSKAFYNLHEKVTPNWKELKKKLNNFGYKLKIL